ncbi:MAG TPA: endonuclease/exonuclease/phosphatase, partial [Allocoleopsis sp.]
MLLLLGLLLPLGYFLSGCSLPQVRAEDRLFLPLSLDFLGSYALPRQDFEGTPVGGLSGITY